MPIEYRSHVANHWVAVVHCPNICRGRLVHLSQDGPDSWVIRDYIMNQELRRSADPNNSDSGHQLAQIEDEVVRSESPPYVDCEQRNDWVTYLRLRTMAFVNNGSRQPVDQSPSSEAFGTWHRFR